MDFMNLMNQFNNGSCSNNNHHNGCGGGDIGNRNCFGNNSILPFLLFSGLGCNNYQRSNFNGGRMTCYPNNNNYGYPQPYIYPTSYPYCDNGIKYRTRKVRQAYMEVPVSTYQIAQPLYNMNNMAQGPTTMNIIPTDGNGGYNNDLWSLLILLSLLCNNNNGRNRNGCGCHHHHNPCGEFNGEASEL